MILGLSGPRVTPGEKAFFRDSNPWAFILFARNIETPEQVKTLTDDLRECVGRDCLVFVDQEGGRVQRLRPPHWRNYPTAAALAGLYVDSPWLSRRLTFLQYRLIADDLRKVGITADCAPVLDLPIAGADPIISDRAFGDTTSMITDLSHAVMAGLMAGGVAPVIKHIPGHGRALVDSHLALPSVSAPHLDLRHSDFMPFHNLCDAPMAMTAHIVYEDIDSDHPITTSRKGIARVIRGEIGFDGLLMSDDLDMKALSGSLTAKTKATLAAGCDVVLQCSGKLPDMVQVAKGIGPMRANSLRRAIIAENCADHIDDFDREKAEAEFETTISALRIAA